MAKVDNIDLKIPNLGDAESTEIIEVNIQPGDTVNLNDPLIVLESEKAAMEIPSDFEGEISKVHVKAGDVAEEGMVFATIMSSKKTNQNAIKKNDSDSPAPNIASEVRDLNTKKEPVEINSLSINAGPAVRKYARELEINLDSIKGTGRDGRITKDDLKRYIHQGMSQKVEDNYPTLENLAKFGPYEIKSLSGIRKAGLKNLLNSWTTVPHVFHFEEINLSRVNSLRESLKCSPLPVIIKGIANTLKKHPLLNSSLLNDSEILLKDYINVGIAVNTENGLVVPVLKNPDKLDIQEINVSIKKLSEKARQKQLKKTDIEGASFTVSSLGKIGGHGFTPIINPPEVAIIGISNTRTNIRLDGKEIIEDMVLPVSLSYDHRVINGVEAGEFMVDLKIELEEKVK